MTSSTSSRTRLAPHVQAFFTEQLCHQKRVSPQTIARCRDTFRLLLLFIPETVGIEPSAWGVTALAAPLVLRFLDYLEHQRGTAVRSRHLRLSALRTFFRFVALRDPEGVALATRVLAIPRKRTDKKLVGYLTREEIDALLAATDRSHWVGRRDHALLLTMYNRGARVSEMTTLRRRQVCVGASTFRHLHGKGRQERTVPLWPQTSRVLPAWLPAVGPQEDQTVLPQARGTPLSRHGGMYLLQQVVHKAVGTCPSRRTKPVSPPVIRHTTAMHRLQAGVDMAVMALWWGHESIATTPGDLEADLTTKERALHTLAPVAEQAARFTADDPLLTCLTSL
jgi:integrase/recombinase XerD